jgi:hypothetical protein
LKKGYVYLICDASNELFKIGVTKSSIEKRIKKLQTGNSTELFVSNYHETYYPFCIETMLHNLFSDKRVLNEWFELSNDDINSFSETCDKLEKRIEVLKENPFFAKNLK